ncbi:gephyrin-like [Corticium candelabrum]|uniref:gephyrin-like n=1 Tax=Corticium candelabrum TaxID=121492 RepID=UPI002E265EF3|nr:gephyrin-like [Corticium candelabrum]
MRCGILTVSDRCSSGETEDESGENLENLLKSSTLKPKEVVRHCVSDDKPAIQDALRYFCDELKLELVLTTGGTGFSPRDVTPEATRPMLEKECPGLVIAMLSKSLNVTPLAMLSRPVAGIRNNTLIINFPGSKKASQECLLFVIPSLPHAMDLLSGFPVNHHHPVQLGASHEEHTDLPHSFGCQHHHPSDRKGKASQTSSRKHFTASSHTDESRIAWRPRHSSYPLTPVSQAMSVILANAQTLQTIASTNLHDALGFVLNGDVFSCDPFPPFRASIKDGYAVIASDGVGERDVIAPITAGEQSDVVVKSGSVTCITTGAAVPEGADAVVQVEDTELVESSEDGRVETKVRICRVPTTGQDIRPVGFDISVGEQILAAGDKLGPSELGLLATVGITEVKVYKKPVVAVLSTGDELVSPGGRLSGSQIYDSNRTILLSLLKQEGFPAIDFGISPDTRSDLVDKLTDAMKQADILVTSGGVSMGEKDLLKTVLIEDLSAHVHFGRVFMKPGKPTTFATATIEGKQKLIFSLPGNPVSANVTFSMFVLPALRKVSGYVNPHLTTIKAKLGFDCFLDPRPEYQRVILKYESDNDLPTAMSTGSQCSSRMLSMRNANALLTLPPQTDEITQLARGTIVDAMVIGHI